jgi:heme exporter protein A
MLSSIVVEKVSKRYGDHRALAKVDLDAHAPARCARCVGPNGAGKSTLLGILSTLVRASAGTVAYLEGERRRKLDDRAARRHRPAGPRSLCYGELTGRSRTWSSSRPCTAWPTAPARAASAARRGRARRRGPAARPVRTYSRGMVQRLALARALLARPSLLLLDEPFTGLDRGGALALGAPAGPGQGRRRDRRVCVTHDLEAIAGVTDHVAVLRRRQAGVRRARPGGVLVRGAARALPRPCRLSRPPPLVPLAWPGVQPAPWEPCAWSPRSPART